jgi:hypothetical protein
MSTDTFYTDKVLDENFRMIRESFDWTAKSLRGIDAHFAHLEGHIAELSKPAEVVIKMSKTRKALPFVAGAVVGIYLYKKSKGFAKKVDAAFNEVKDSTSRNDAETTVVIDPEQG